MQRFHEFNVLYVKFKDKALADLGIDKSDVDYLDTGSIDLNEVESFSKCYELHEGTQLIKIQLKSGAEWTIQCKYEAFKEIIK